MKGIVKELIYRLRIGLPKGNYRTFTARIKWFLFGVSGSVYEFGSCGGKVARKDKRDGSVAFVLWKAGEQGHKVDCQPKIIFIVGNGNNMG